MASRRTARFFLFLFVLAFAIAPQILPALEGTTQCTVSPGSGVALDVMLIVDLSASFDDDLPVFKVQAPSIIAALKASNANTRFGLGKFEDYPITPFGIASAGDKAYERLVDLTFETDRVLLPTIASLVVRHGGDTPESQLAALFQAATGQGQDLAREGFPQASIPPGQQAHFREGATKLFLIWTDAPFHRPADPGAIPYPGPSLASTVNAIVALDHAKVIGISSGSDGAADLRTIATQTGALAPPGGIDCNRDGVIDVAAGQPLVCSIGTSGAGLAEATIALIEAAASTFTVDATRGWQTTSLKVTTGQQVAFAAVGTWTVDFRSFSKVGAEGYTPAEDSRIFQGCKLDPTLPYGKLLARVGDAPSFQVIGKQGTLVADREGLVAFRIHDVDACLVDNEGKVTVTVACVNKPVFIYPVNGQTLDYVGSYLFKVEPIAQAQGFLWGFFQNGVMVWENYRDEGKLSTNEYGIHPATTAYSKFVRGAVDVWVRALIDGQWTDAAIITIYLR